MATIYTGTQGTSGDGTAAIDPGATKKVRLNGLQQLQAEAAGPVTVLLKVGSTTIHRGYFANAGDGVIIDLDYTGAVGEKVYVNVSGNISCGYVLNADIIGA